MVAILPDIAGAVNARLRSSSDIAALASTRISTARQAAWGLPSYAVLIEAGKGGGEDTPGLQWERIDLRCYGPDARTANLLWRTVHAFFCPPVGSGRASAFVVAGASVVKVEQEGGPLRLVEPDETWPYTFASYRVYYAVDAVA